WERVFMLYDNSVFTRTLSLGAAGQMMNFVGWANLARSHTRMKLITAVATLVAESIGVIEYREVAAKLGEMATYCEMWRHAMDGVQHRAYPLENGLWSLGSDSGMRIWAAQVSSRLVQLLREICGSGIIMQPSENDLASPELRPHLDRFMGGRGVDVE